MKISEQWLREWANPRLDTKTLAERLTMAGLEVGSVTPAAPKLGRIVVGEILSVTPHPSAERLHVCQVDIGKGKPLTVVSGAENVRVNMKVPLALPGAILPDGKTIDASEIRGVGSAGMLCSAEELGLDEKSTGLLDLGAGVKKGADIVAALALDDYVLEVELTPNRGDCLSARGLAREVAALTGTKLSGPRSRPVKVKSKRCFEIKLEAATDCTRYAGRVVEDINPQATTPLWMRERLRRAGQRSVHPVVDVTNYVMLELGQPMHAFDLERLAGRIVVRRTRGGESLALLDGSTIETGKDTLVIADTRGPVALAGIMGGQASAVDNDTRHVFLESAYFQPETIAGRARSLGKQSESSHRFERGVDPALQVTALERATELLLGVVGGKAGPIVERKARNHLLRQKPVHLRDTRVASLLGIDITPKTIENILSSLGMRVTRSGNGFRVVPPSWRFDIRREVDLIEEVARVYGYHRIPSTRPKIEMLAPPTPEGRVSESRLRSVLVDRDYQEIISYSFVDPKLQALLDPKTAPLMLANPISAEMAAMRTSLWPGLIQTILHNQNRQQARLRIFELGRRFVLSGSDLKQQLSLGGAVTGSVYAEQWGVPAREGDFYDVKADIEALFTPSGRPGDLRFKPSHHPALHPGGSAEILLHDTSVGILGTLHPGIQTKLGLDRNTVVFEIAASALTQAKVPTFREISRFPALRRDLALVMSEDIAARRVLDCVEKVAGILLVNLELFDEYRGKGIDSGRKSLALGLTLQDSSRTLKEAEVDAVVSRVIAALQTELGAQLRT